jgi:nucleotide-binding universal stress UspA family protein
MYRKILIPLDNAATDKAILTHIRPLARSSGAKLVLVHVADGFGARLQDQLNLSDSEEIVKDRLYLEAVAHEFESEGFTVARHLLRGDPADGIMNIAMTEGCDLIAMATHGHRFFMDWFLGSVADSLHHKSNIPILMVRGAKPEDSSGKD